MTKQALVIAAAIAEQLKDPAKPPAPAGRHGSTPQSLANGAAGIALLHIERARTGQGDWNTAHAWICAAANGDISAGPNASIYFGAPALAFVVAAHGSGRYARALAHLRSATATLTRRRLDHAHARIDRGDRPALAEFDLIRGLTGLGAYYLHCEPEHELITAVLTYLVRLTEPIRGLPGWWTDHGPTGNPLPGGHGNLGLAHGITGPLALLALAKRRGITVTGQAAAIDRICSWLDGWQQPHSAGPWWPRTISRQEHDTGHPQQAGPAQPSWCYGTPGIARAMQLAALATAHPQRQHTAELALLGCLDDGTQLKELIEPGLCHGIAGLFHTAHRIAQDSPTTAIANRIVNLTTTLLSQSEMDAHGPGLLEGTAGLALTLHSLTEETPPPRWDACLLLA
jgi:class I lanthipeptide synthase